MNCITYIIGGAWGCDWATCISGGDISLMAAILYMAYVLQFLIISPKDPGDDMNSFRGRYRHWLRWSVPRTIPQMTRSTRTWKHRYSHPRSRASPDYSSESPKTESWHAWHIPLMLYSRLDNSSLNSPTGLPQHGQRCCLTRCAAFGIALNAGLLRSGIAFMLIAVRSKN